MTGPSEPDDGPGGVCSVIALDLRGLLCPIPVIRTASAVAAASAGDLLVLTCTDPGVREDMPIWSRMHGHQIEDMTEEEHLIRIRLRVGETGTDDEPGSTPESGAHWKRRPKLVR